MIGFGSSSNKSRSEFTTKKFPGLFGDADNPVGQQIGEQLLSLINQPTGQPPELDPFGGSFPFAKALQSNVLDPQFGGQPNGLSTVQQALVDAARSKANAGTSFRGLEPTTTSQIRAIAPLLAGFQQQNVQNLQKAQDSDLQQKLAVFQLINNFAQNRRGQDLQTGLSLADLSLPTIIGGNNSSATGRSFNFGISGGGK